MVKFGCEVTKHFKNNPLGRQLDEAKRIQEEAGELLNDKNEWFGQLDLPIMLQGCEEIFGGWENESIKSFVSNI